MTKVKAVESLWEKLHKIPEPAFHEVKTAAFVADFLEKAGYQVTAGLTPAQTGVIAVLDSGKKGPVVGIRSDMDCLLLQEKGKAVPVHACGHDAHMAVVLTVAQQLARQGLKKGKLLVIMQPAEEVGLGAKAMLKTGLLKDLDYLFGLHVMPSDLAKNNQAIAQINWTACTLLTADLKGRTAHGSMPQLGINVVDAGTAIVNAINAIHLDPQGSWSVKTTRFITDNGSLNAIPDHGILGFDLRSTKNSEMALLKRQVTQQVNSVAKAYGVKATLKIIGTCPASEPTPALQELVEKTIVKELGTKGLIRERSTTVGEDFNFYKQLMPKLQTGFIGLGCNLKPGLHAANMHFDHSQLIHGVNILADLVQTILR